MGWLESLRTAWEALYARKMRSLLTMLGILIGIAAVMLTVGLGAGAQTRITQEINSLGSNLIIVTPGTSSLTVSGIRGATNVTTLTSDDAAILSMPSVAPDIAAVASVSSSRAALVAGTSTWTSTITATSPDWFSVTSRTISQGRAFLQGDLDAANSVAVLGATTATELYGTRDPVGQSLTVGNQTFTVIGVMASAGSSLSGSQDDMVVIPRTTFVQRLSTSANSRAVNLIYIQGRDANSLAAAYQETTAALLTSHQVTAANQDFNVSTQEALVAAAASITGIITALLGGIAAISLLVGGIGVMNIMLVSVSERVREIGLRKALGARPALIRRQFLVEAGVLGLLGGFLGVSLGLLGAAILTPIVGVPVTISWSATAMALGVSLGIGVVPGVYPASRAAKLAPIDALRSE